MSVTAAKRGSIVTFYSYKGGVGRTLVLANVGVVLAEWGYRVLVVDWDLEAPGLDEYLRPLLSGPLQGGVVDVISSDQRDWHDFVAPVHVPSGEMAFLGAGGAVADYVTRVQALDLPALYENRNLGGRIEVLRDEWKADFDFVLVDSRTGIGDIGGICTVQIPDILCVCFTTTRQSFYGALNVAARAQRERAESALDRARLLMIPLITRFEASVEFELAQKWEREFADHVGPLVEDWLPREIEPDRLLPHLRVPYVPHWSLGEHLPALEDERTDPLSVGYAIETIAAVVARHAVDPTLLVENRQLYVDAADRSGTAGRRRSSLFSADFVVVADPREMLYAMQLMGGLRESGFKVAAATASDTEETDEMKAAQHVVLVVGADPSPQLLAEYRRFILDLIASETSRILVPVVHAPGGTARLPPPLRTFQWVNAWERPLPDVVREIADRVGRRTDPIDAGPSELDLDVWFEQSTAAFNRILQDSEYEDRYRFGTWRVAYSLQPSPDLDFRRLREAMIASEGPETGWPEWMWRDFGDVPPRIVDGVVECWLASSDRTFAGGSHSDYWRASPTGEMFLLRGYEDDDDPSQRPGGELFDLSLPIWRTAEAFMHSARFSRNAGIPGARARVRCVWSGLNGRTLTSWAQPRRLFSGSRPATQDTAQKDVVVATSDVEQNLPHAVHEMLKDVYMLFDFFELPFGLVEDEVNRFLTSRTS